MKRKPPRANKSLMPSEIIKAACVDLFTERIINLMLYNIARAACAHETIDIIELRQIVTTYHDLRVTPFNQMLRHLAKRGYIRIIRQRRGHPKAVTIGPALAQIINDYAQTIGQHPIIWNISSKIA